MSITRIVLFLADLFTPGNEAVAQRLDVRGVRMLSKTAGVATIVLKSEIDSLSITSTSNDSIEQTKCNYENVWT